MRDHFQAFLQKSKPKTLDLIQNKKKILRFLLFQRRGDNLKLSLTCESSLAFTVTILFISC
jgi:hypothetical protein